MRTITSLCVPLMTILCFLSLHQGLATESGCKLVFSKNKQSLAVKIGSTGELTCQISPECSLTKRIIGPFWTRPDGNWFVPNLRMYNIRINSTTISLRYSKIIHEDLGIYHCIARIGGNMLNITANITEMQGKQGDVVVTAGPDPKENIPMRKRSADLFAGIEHVKAEPLRNYRRLAARSLQNQAKDTHHGNPPLTGYPTRGGEGDRSQFQSRHIGIKVRYM